MKITALKFNRIYCLIAAVILGITGLNAQDIEKSKSYNYSQKFAPEGVFNLNTHSDLVKVNVWTKNEVKIIATVRAEAEDEKDLDAFLADIKLEPRSTDNSIELSNGLMINSKPTYQLGSLFSINRGTSQKVELTNGDKIKLKNLKVKYEIFIPAKTRLNLRSSYGEVEVIGDLLGETTFDLNSSKFQAENLGRTKISLKYGKARFKSMKDGKINLFEGKLEMETGRELEINSKYSKFSIGQTRKITLQSFEDKVKIGKTDELILDMKYGELILQEARMVDIKKAYEVEMEIQKVDQLKSSSSKYSDYKIVEVNDLLFSDSFEVNLQVSSVNRLNFNGKYGKVTVDKLAVSCEVRGFETDASIAQIDADFRLINMEGKYMKIKLNMPNVSFKYQSKITYGNVKYIAQDYQVVTDKREGEPRELEMSRKGEAGSSELGRVSIFGLETNVVLN